MILCQRDAEVSSESFPPWYSPGGCGHRRHTPGGAAQEGRAGRVHRLRGTDVPRRVAVLAGWPPGLEEHSDSAQEVFAFLPWARGSHMYPQGQRTSFSLEPLWGPSRLSVGPRPDCSPCGFLSRSGPRFLSFKRFSLKIRLQHCTLSRAAVIQGIPYVPTRLRWRHANVPGWSGGEHSSGGGAGADSGCCHRLSLTSRGRVCCLGG